MKDHKFLTTNSSIMDNPKLVLLGLRRITPDIFPLLHTLQASSFSIVSFTAESHQALVDYAIPHTQSTSPLSLSPSLVLANLPVDALDVGVGSVIRGAVRAGIPCVCGDFGKVRVGEVGVGVNARNAKALEYASAVEAMVAKRLERCGEGGGEGRRVRFVSRRDSGYAKAIGMVLGGGEGRGDGMGNDGGEGEHEMMGLSGSSAGEPNLSGSSAGEPKLRGSERNSSAKRKADGLSENESKRKVAGLEEDREDTEDDLVFSVGAGDGDDVGPSKRAMQICESAVADEDTDGEFTDMCVLVFCDGSAFTYAVLNAQDVRLAGLMFGPDDNVYGTPFELTSATGVNVFAAVNRVLEMCAFNGVPYQGPMVLNVSRRGRVVGVETENVSRLSHLFSLIPVEELKETLECCCAGSLAYSTQRPTITAPDVSTKPRTSKLRIATLGSTLGGSSLQPIIEALSTDGSFASSVEIVVALSDKQDAGVLRRASERGIPIVQLSAKGKTRVEFDARVSDELARRGVDLIVLVGYMRILSNEFCDQWEGRILNVHPSLLPDFAGGMDLEVHRAVLAAKKNISGCTVHLVTKVVDGGPIVVKKSCPVDPENDTPETLKAKVQALEGPSLIEAILAFAMKTGYFAAKTDRLTYESAGVSTARGDELVERIKSFCKATRRPGCDSDLGGFGANFDYEAVKDEFPDPIVVSGTDGVGTKLLLAQQYETHDTVGIDLVAMSVNDLIVQGATPMFFLDYFACGKLDVDIATRVVSGVARGCEYSGCSLVGGETAEMPGMYGPNEYDLAGFAVGLVDRSRLLPRAVRVGDVLIGLPSSGIHSNGYSLVRKLFNGVDMNGPAPFPSTKPTLKQVIMEPTKIYYKTLRVVLKLGLIEALSHITGSGLPGNLPRVYPKSLAAHVDLNSWIAPAVFQYMATNGPVDRDEMLDTFNCGVGMVLIVRPENVQRVMDCLGGYDEAFVMGKMIHRLDETMPLVQFTGIMKGIPKLEFTNISITYAAAGVDIIAGDRLVDRIKPLCRATKRIGCDSDLGGFGALFDLAACKIKNPVLVSGTDGVGTKLLLAQKCDGHDTVGQDLVAMSVNDLIVQGAEPLVFLDYFACGKLDVDLAARVVAGVAEGCRLSGAALAGGETAEMPGLYDAEEYDMAGFAFGVVEKEKLLPRRVLEGDFVVGLKSSGIHSNGYSLVRKIVEKSQASLNDPAPFLHAAPRLGTALLTPTKIYWNTVRPLLAEDLIEAMAHVTGSGITGNLPRVYPNELYAEIDLRSWTPPPVFCWLASAGNVETKEMLDTFNCGLGMVLFVRGKEKLNRILDLCRDECFGVVGVMKSKQASGDESVQYVNMSNDVFRPRS